MFSLGLLGGRVWYVCVLRYRGECALGSPFVKEGEREVTGAHGKDKTLIVQLEGAWIHDISPFGKARHVFCSAQSVPHASDGDFCFVS